MSDIRESTVEEEKTILEIKRRIQEMGYETHLLSSALGGLLCIMYADYGQDIKDLKFFLENQWKFLLKEESEIS